MRRALAILPAAFCAALSLAAPPPAWAESPVVIEGADADMGAAILDLLPERDRPQTLFEAERIAEEAAARATAWLRSEGYYAAEVTPQAQETPAQARLLIAPGPRFRLAAATLAFEGDAPDADTQAAMRAALALAREGAPARAGDVLAAEAAALTALQQAGYADAASAERRIVVDHAANQVAAEYRFSAGALARLGEVRAEPSEAFRPGFVRSLRNWELGDRSTPLALARLRRDMSATGAVSRVGTALAPPNAEGLRDVVLSVEPAKRNAYELGLSYSTTEGAGVVAQWTRRNLTHRADALTLTANVGEIAQNLSAELTRPHAAGLGHAVRFGVSAEHEAPEAYSREGVAMYASVDASTRLRHSRSYGVRLSSDAYDDLAGGVRRASVLSGSLDLRRDTTDFTLDPRAGTIAEVRLEPSVSTGSETLGFVRAIAEGRAYTSLGEDDDWTLAGRMRAGWLEAVAGDADDAPPDRRFYAGGGGSVRGYDYNAIYPRERDALGLAPGGQGLFEVSAEARVRLGARLGAALFVDGGAAFDHWSEASDLSWGVGVGGRYNLGFAPLRVDIAFPLDNRQTTQDYALYISLGQAF